MEIWIKFLSEAKSFHEKNDQNQYTFDTNVVCFLSCVKNNRIVNNISQKMEGYLERLVRFNSWNKRYYLLRDGFLIRYRTNVRVYLQQQYQMGKLPLYHAKLEEYQPNKYDRCFEIIDAKGKEKWILRAKDQEEMHTWLNSIVKEKVLIEDSIDSIRL